MGCPAAAAVPLLLLFLLCNQILPPLQTGPPELSTVDFLPPTLLPPPPRPPPCTPGGGEEVRLLLLGMKEKAAGRSVVVMVDRWCGGHQSTVQCPDATLMFLSIGIYSATQTFSQWLNIWWESFWLCYRKSLEVQPSCFILVLNVIITPTNLRKEWKNNFNDNILDQTLDQGREEELEGEGSRGDCP